MDIANIYNLSEEELDQYRNEPFPDDEIRPGLKDFAKKFKEELSILSTPYVLALEGGYGTGKSYFITRFCEYLKKINFENDEIIFSIYLNLWEKDYVENPFSVIAAHIISALNPAEELQQSIRNNALKVAKNLIKFGAKKLIDLDVEDLLPDPKKEKEDIKTFKQSIKKAIAEKGKKVVLVVDELDRCKPDYAVKSLEVIKHFFDIEGLIIILTTKLDFMDNMCEAYYGHPQCKINMGEGYIQKFVQTKKILNPTSKDDYLFIIKKFLNNDVLPLIKTKIQGFPDLYGTANAQALQVFQSNLSSVFYEGKLSIRKTIVICNELKNLIIKYKEDIWINKCTGFPEMILIKYLKYKSLISNSLQEPKVNWEYPINQIERDKAIEDLLKKML